MLYKRDIQEKINKWLEKEEIILLNGPRQVGKTSLLKLLRNKLMLRQIKKEQIFYLNLEKLEVQNDLNKSPQNLLNYITIKNRKAYFLLDEIQYLDNPSNFLKHIYDEYRNKVKLIITGSSSLELKAKLQDSLAGRKISFMVNPLCFGEFLRFKKADVLDYYHKGDIPLEVQNKMKKLLDEYLLFGGMPKVVLTDGKEAKKILLKNYVSDYVNKDIRYIGKIDSLLKFNQLVKILASQIGDLLNINELTNTLNMPRKKAESYLDLLEYTFILDRIVPYHKNIRSQITKMPKVYWTDLGIRNQILDNFTKLTGRNDNGKLFENFVYLELKNKMNKEKIHFYRTVHKAEIDFIFEKNGIVYPIETKYKNFSRSTGSRVLSGFCNNKNINCPAAYIVNINLNQKHGRITFLDFINLLTSEF